MKTRYIVTYDITDDGRRDTVYKALRGYGDHLQYSVFRCDLSERDIALMVTDLHPLIDHVQDQILLIDIGPVEGRADTCITSIGKRYQSPQRTVVVI